MSFTHRRTVDADVAPNQIAALLRLPGAAHYRDVDLAIHVRGGLPLVSFQAMADIVGVAAAAYHFPLAHDDAARGQQRNMTPVESNRLYCLARIVIRLLHEQRMNEPDVRAYLTQPHPRLNGLRPIAIATMNSAGAAAVERLISQDRTEPLIP